MTTLQLPPELVLAFGLLSARAGGLTLGLPPMLGVSVPVKLRVLLAMLLAGALMPLASVAPPAASGLAPIAILVVRELAMGLTMAFAAALVVGAAMMAGDMCGAGMELNSGGLLRATVQMPNVVADGFATFASAIFFLAGFHRALIIALARSLTAAPLGRLTLPPPIALLHLGGRVFGLALGLGLPIMIPLFVLAVTQGVIARLAPQVNVLVAAPAALVLAGLFFLVLDAVGLGAGLEHLWSAVMDEALGWLDG